jgi:hypothetical protein
VHISIGTAFTVIPRGLQLTHEGISKAVHAYACLGSDIGDRSPVTSRERDHSADVDDPTTGLRQVRDRGETCEESAFEVGVQHVVPQLLRRFQRSVYSHRVRHAGIVDEDVEATEGFGDLVYRNLQLQAVSDVGDPVDHRWAVKALGARPQAALVTADQSNRCTGLGEGRRDRAPDAAGSSGDDLRRVSSMVSKTPRRCSAVSILGRGGLIGWDIEAEEPCGS